MSDPHNDLNEILHSDATQQRPAPKKKSGFNIFIIIILLCLIIAGGVWGFKQFLEKGEVELPLPPEVAKVVNENLHLGEDGRLGPVRIVDGSKPAAGQNGPVSAVGQPVKEDDRPSAGALLPAPSSSAEMLVQNNQPAATEQRTKIYTGSDAVITMGFVNDLALYLAESYWPKGSHISAANGPFSSAGISSINQRYGVELTGFAATRERGGKRDYQRERSLVLNYAFKPAMLNALSKLYADRFAEQLVFLSKQQSRRINGETRLLNDADAEQMLRYYAAYGKAVALALRTYAAKPDAPFILNELTKAENASYEATVNMQEAQYALEIAQEDQNRVAQIEAERALEKGKNAYRESMLKLQESKEAVARMLSGSEGLALENADLIYIASWASRRGDAAATLKAAADAADYAAAVLTEHADELEQFAD